MIGKTITTQNAFTFIEHVGRTSTWDVWSAFDERLGRTVAIKTFLGMNTPEARVAFQQDAKTQVSLTHPNILPIYDFGYQHDVCYLVTHSLTGGSLADRLFDGPLPIRETLNISSAVAKALDYAHAHHILHQDVKPANILLDELGNPYLSDFLLTRAIAFVSEYTTGTIMYTPPEILTGNVVDHRADVYSLGVSLYQMFTGEFPFEGEAPLALKQLQFGEDMPDPRAYNPDLPAHIVDILRTATAMHVEARHPSAGALMNALSLALTGQQAITEGVSDFTPGKTFISYARANSNYVHPLTEALRKLGVRVWIDQEIPPGANWDQAVQQSLDACDRMLLVLSKQAVESRNVADEWSYYLDEQKPIYPLIYEACDLPFRLRRLQHIMATNSVEHDAAAVTRILAGKAPFTDRTGAS